MHFQLVSNQQEHKLGLAMNMKEYKNGGACYKYASGMVEF